MLEIINAIETSYSECCSTKNDKSRRSIYKFRNMNQAIKKASDCCLEVVNKEEEDNKSVVSSIETSEIPDTTPMEEEAEQNQFVFVEYFYLSCLIHHHLMNVHQLLLKEVVFMIFVQNKLLRLLRKKIGFNQLIQLWFNYF